MRYTLIVQTLTFTALLYSLNCISAADLRQWTDASGKFNVNAELLTADDDLGVLEQKDGELIALQREQLSREDRRPIRKFSLMWFL